MSEHEVGTSIEQPVRGSSNRTTLAGITVLLIGSEAVYLSLLQLNAINGWTAVSTFWLHMTLLFGLYAAAIWLLQKCSSRSRSKLWLIIFGAVLFRATLLPAGLPHDLTAGEKLDAMRADIAGTEVAYERFQLFDNDIWRYIWDGYVWANRINPYLYPPNDGRLDSLAGEETALSEESESADELGDDDLLLDLKESPDSSANSVNDFESIPESTRQVENAAIDKTAIWSDIRDNVNHAEVTTIYPPLAQVVFQLSYFLAPGSVAMMKIVLVGCELIGILFLILTLRRLNLPEWSVILYAWNPLMIKVFAGSGHADAILVAAICATAYFLVRGSRVGIAGAFGLAILAKLSPVILLPFVFRRIGWKWSLFTIAVVAAGYFPFLDAGQNLFAGFLRFAREWEFNAGFFGLVQWLMSGMLIDPSFAARQVSGIVLIGLIGFLTLKDDLSIESFLTFGALVIGSTIVLSPTVMPWYLSWVLPLAVLARQYVWFYFSFLVLAAFHVLIEVEEYAAVLWLEHGVFYLLLFRELHANRNRTPLTFGWKI